METIQFFGGNDWRALECKQYVRGRIDFPVGSSVHEYSREQLRLAMDSRFRPFGVQRPAHYVNQMTEMGVTRPLTRAIRCF